MNRISKVFVLSGVVALGACSGGGDAAKSADEAQPSGTPAVQAAAGDTIIVEMHTDATGNYYKPNEIEAEKGDVIRFVLKSGVHNVNFLPDSNEIKTGLPPASDMLQLPDQTYDLVVTMQEGHYYFHCDPHAALGMKGKLEVEDED